MKEAKPMGLFSKRQAFEDSVYARRLARGEVQEKPIIIPRPNELEMLRREVRELTEENRRLRKEISSYQQQVETFEYVHNIDELIETMKEEKTTKPSGVDVWSSLLKGKPSTSATDDSGINLLLPASQFMTQHLPDNAEFEDEVVEDEVGWNDEER